MRLRGLGGSEMGIRGRLGTLPGLWVLNLCNNRLTGGVPPRLEGRFGLAKQMAAQIGEAGKGGPEAPAKTR